jgi:hypothetical protein
MNSVGDSFAWPFQDQQFFSKILVQGLITIIPIVGWIATFGWFMMIIDNYRAGRRELPPAGFHLEARGIAIFVVYAVWAIVFSIPGGVIQSIGRSNDNGGVSALGSLIGLVLSLLLAFLAPSIISSTHGAGFAGGFNVGGIWQRAMVNPTNSVIAGLLIWVASIISWAGIILQLRRPALHHPYGVAIMAGVVAWFEGVSGGGGTAMAPAAPPPPPPAPAAPTA